MENFCIKQDLNRRRHRAAACLRQHEAGRAKSPVVVQRLLALSQVLDGIARETAAKTSGMDRQTLRDWVHRTNAEGVACLWCGGSI